MPINNAKGLAALRALAEGGSAGAASYNQAKSSEAASRTTALQNALGGQDVGAAVAAAQAKYSPAVDTSAPSVGNLGAAADSYLSQQASKLASQNYEDQANLTLSAAKLQQKQNEMSAADREAALTGAADVWAEGQKTDLANTLNHTPLQQLADQKAAQRARLTQFDAEQAAIANGTAGVGAAASGVQQGTGAAASGVQQGTGVLPGGPQGTAAGASGMVQGTGALAGLTAAAAPPAPDPRGDILREMAATDAAYKQAAEGYAGALGTDTKGLLDTYARADQGDAGAVRDLTNWLGANQAAPLLETKGRQIDLSGQSRLRALAPAFGIDPLVAAGRYREGEGNDLARMGQIGKENAAATGAATPKERDTATAEGLGFDNVSDYKAVRTKSRMSDDEIVDAMNSEAWNGIQDIYQGAVTGEIPGGAAGLQEGIKSFVNGLAKPDGMDDSEWKKKRTQLIQLGSTYFKSPTSTAAGSDQSAVEE